MNAPATLVDAHVHVHSGMDTEGMLTAAYRNFASVAQKLALPRWQGVLMLAEISGRGWFGALADRRGARRCGRWQIDMASPASAVATGDGRTLTIIAGRQLVTAERLEVLALSTASTLPDGLPLEQSISAAQDAGALVVLPWGAGKWFGKRGQLVERALYAERSNRIFPGDNGGRPSFWPEPEVFSSARSRGLPVLPGTDPLPLPGEEYRVGSRGFWFSGSLPREPDGQALQRSLMLAGVSGVHSFGRCESPWRFLRNQIGLRTIGCSP